MIQIKKQIHAIYLNSAFSAFQIAGASWVALLAARGFSLAEIGIAESIFHLTSLIAEMPSGVFSDVMGRRKGMLVSQIMSVLSALLMFLSRGMPEICLAMVFSALSYNFSSGTREALAYDSLKSAHQESEYNDFSSTELTIYTISRSAATLCAGLALLLGFRTAYLIDTILASLCLLVTARLQEVPAESMHAEAGKRLRECIRESISFLRQHPEGVRIMILNSLVGAVSTMMLFCLQERLPAHGLSGLWFGPALFLMGMGSALGARTARHLRHWSFQKTILITAAAVLLCLRLSLSFLPAVMIPAGFLSAMADSILEVRSDVLLNDMVPSGQRATLLSVSSLSFSMIMIFMSPLLTVVFARF
jgi:MFS family permease